MCAWKSGQSGNPAGRPKKSDAEKLELDLFREKIKQNTGKAIDVIVSLMEKSLDASIRLKAAQYIVNKAVGEGFIAFNGAEEQQKEVIINLVTTKTNINENINELAEKAVADVEREGTIDSDSWDIETEDSGDWGEQIYQPQKKAKKVSTE